MFQEFLNASLAQLAEHALRKRMVAGSIPAGGFFQEERQREAHSCNLHYSKSFPFQLQQGAMHPCTAPLGLSYRHHHINFV